MSGEAPVHFREGLGVKFPPATRPVVHARSLEEAKKLLEAIRSRLLSCGLELHPEKTKIVYCKDEDRRGNQEHTKFDFLRYTFRPRRAKNRRGKLFISFLPGVSTKAANSIRETIRSWRIGASRNNQSLEEIARFVNPFVRGWVNYYARIYPSAHELLRLGIGRVRARVSAHNGHGPWWNAGASHMNQALPTRYFTQLGLVSLVQKCQELNRPLN